MGKPIKKVIKAESLRFRRLAKQRPTVQTLEEILKPYVSRLSNILVVSVNYWALHPTDLEPDFKYVIFIYALNQQGIKPNYFPDEKSVKTGISKYTHDNPIDIILIESEAQKRLNLKGFTE